MIACPPGSYDNYVLIGSTCGTSTHNFMTAAHPIRFRIQPLSPEAHLYEISCVIPDPDPAGQGFSLPAWIPGSYMIREFAKNVVQLWAETETGAVAVGKIDKNTWRCAPCRGPLTLRYHVYAWDKSVRGAHLNSLCQDLAQICEYHIRFFGEPPPMERYLLLVTAVGNGYGGLEHRASCSLMCSRDDLPRANQGEMTEKYRTFLGLCSHEYFHTWNVKRITPAVFVAPDLAVENYTTQLWAFEGITSYYQNLALLRCGMITPETYLELLALMATRVGRTGGRFKQSLAEASFDAWIKLYKQDDIAPNAIISYYTKGALVALALDLLIRRDTRNARSLDDVMRALWRRYGEHREGVPEGGVEAIAAEVSGLDLREIFDQAIRGTGELPLTELLTQFGVQVELRPAEAAADAGGRRAKTPVEQLLRRGDQGVRLVEEGGEARLQYVYDASAAQRAGLAAVDGDHYV